MPGLLLVFRLVEFPLPYHVLEERSYCAMSLIRAPTLTFVQLRMSFSVPSDLSSGLFFLGGKRTTINATATFDVLEPRIGGSTSYKK